jgi:hypothetical protein
MFGWLELAMAPLALETLSQPGLAGKLVAQYRDRDCPVEPRVFGAIHVSDASSVARAFQSRKDSLVFRD